MIDKWIGLILPPFIDIINKRISDSRIRFVVAALICLAVSVVTKWSSLVVGSVPDFLNSAAMVFAESQIVYGLYWSNSQLRTTMKDKIL